VDFDLVSTPRDGAAWRGAPLLSGRFRRLLRRAGLLEHFTLYGLRCTYVTSQFLAGGRDKVVSELMGHERVRTTKDVYMKVLPVMQERASDGLERLFFGGIRTTLAQSESELPM